MPSLSCFPGPYLASFWPHNSAQRRQLLRIAEQRSGRSTACEPVADAPADLYGSGGWGAESLQARREVR
jgi:hypothetical protein